MNNTKDIAIILAWVGGGTLLFVLLLCGIFSSGGGSGGGQSQTSSTATKKDFYTAAEITTAKRVMETISSHSRTQIAGGGYAYPMYIERTVTWNAMWRSMTVSEKQSLTISLAAYKNCVYSKGRWDSPYIELRDLYTDEKFASIGPWHGFRVY